MKSFLTRSLFALVAVFSVHASAQELALHGPTAAQIEQMAIHNQNVAAQEKQLGPVFRSNSVQPFYEYGKTGYVVMSDDNFGGIATDMKYKLAENLPADVTLIIYTETPDKSYQLRLFNEYAKHIPASRLQVLDLPNTYSNDFWSRDNLPLPVFTDGNFTLVDAKYYYSFEPDAMFSQVFGVSLDAHNYFYEGGNFMANSRGDCLMVNRKRNYPGGTSDTAAIPDDVFKTKYGCKTITRFKHLKGIGHADEVVKFMSDDVLVTDTPEYKAILEQKGFTVYLLPEADLNYETYINSLIVNDTVFVPIFGESHDQDVMNTYKSLGFKVVGINTRDLATSGQGGVHCMTMNYPPSPLKDLTHFLQTN